MLNVLVLDDSKEDRFFICRALRKATDATPIEFSYADEALAFLRTPDRPSIDLILADISMPRVNGFQFADRFMELYPELKGSAPLYIVSSSIDPDDSTRAQAHPGIAGLLPKPLTSDALNKVIKQVADKA